MKKFLPWLIAIIVVVIVGAVLIFKKGGTPDQTQTQLTPTPVVSGPAINDALSTDNTISIFEQSFNPSFITVMAGTTVTCTNNDGMTHQIVSDQDSTLTDLSSPVLNPGDTYKYTFTQVGSWGYHCSLHPDEAGQVEVITGE